MLHGRMRVRRIARLTAAAIAFAATAAGTPGPATAADPVVGAAGDIACTPADPYFNGGLGTSTRCRQRATSDLMIGSVDAVLPLGDVQDDCATAAELAAGYDPSWGRLKAITKPVPGNHEYYDPDDPNYDRPAECNATAQPYFDYFSTGTSLPPQATDATKGYYSYDLGDWHVVALNTGEFCRVVKCGVTSAQVAWLRQDLAANRDRCTLAYMHYPRFSSKSTENLNRYTEALWNTLYEGGAEVVLGGHVHHYERFAPQTPAGVADPVTGIRQFIVGTGGSRTEAVAASPKPNSEANIRAFGVLKLTLSPTSYGWRFVGIDGADLDSGSADCHGRPGGDPPEVNLTSPADGATVTGTIGLTADASDDDAVASVRFAINGVTVGTDTTAPYAMNYDTRRLPDGAITVSATATDISGKTTTSAAAAVRVSNPPLGDATGIFRHRLGTSGATRIVRPPVGPVRGFDVAPDGNRYAYADRLGVVVIDRTGGNARPLPATAGATAVAWAAGERILFVRAGALWATSTAGAAPVRIASGRIVDVAASPSGSRVVYQARTANGSSDLFTITATGGGRTNITRTPGISEIQPAWRDEATIGFARRDGGWAVHQIGRRGGTSRRVTSPSLGCTMPAYNAAGTRLVCVARTAGGTVVLRSMTATGSRVRTLRTGRRAPTLPLWTGTSTVAFVAASS